MIYHPECQHGQHSINNPDKLQILGIFKTNKGKSILYKDFNNKEFFYDI